MRAGLAGCDWCQGTGVRPLHAGSRLRVFLGLVECDHSRSGWLPEGHDLQLPPGRETRYVCTACRSTGVEIIRVIERTITRVFADGELVGEYRHEALKQMPVMCGVCQGRVVDYASPWQRISAWRRSRSRALVSRGRR